MELLIVLLVLCLGVIMLVGCFCGGVMFVVRSFTGAFRRLFGKKT